MVESFEIVLFWVTFLVGGFLTFTQTFGLIYMMYKKENERVLKIKELDEGQVMHKPGKL